MELSTKVSGMKVNQTEKESEYIQTRQCMKGIGLKENRMEKVK